MQMTESEIKTNILQAKDQIKQIPICAQVNACSVDKIKEILKKQGVDLSKERSPQTEVGTGERIQLLKLFRLKTMTRPSCSCSTVSMS